MNRLGIHTGADLKRQTVDFLQQNFGKAGPYYHAIAHGHDDRPVIADRPRKSVGSETTFSEDLSQTKDIEAGVGAMLNEVWGWCGKTGVSGRTVTVKIKYADFQQVTRSRTHQEPIAQRSLLETISLELVRSVFPLSKKNPLAGCVPFQPRSAGRLTFAAIGARIMRRLFFKEARAYGSAVRRHHREPAPFRWRA